MFRFFISNKHNKVNRYFTVKKTDVKFVVKQRLDIGKQQKKMFIVKHRKTRAIIVLIKSTCIKTNYLYTSVTVLTISFYD
jgi:hypothetical protein